MKLAILASILAAASAFAPSNDVAKTSVATNMAFEDALGSQPPLGFFDPLNLITPGGKPDEAKFERMRLVEIKHGRIAMLGVVGYLVTAAGVRLGGTIDKAGTTFAEIPYGFKALDAMPIEGIYQIIGLCGFLEAVVMLDVTGKGEFVGDFRNGWIDYGWDKFDEETKFQKRAIELNNGRAAMMGMLALMVHEKLGVSILPGGL